MSWRETALSNLDKVCRHLNVLTDKVILEKYEHISQLSNTSCLQCKESVNVWFCLQPGCTFRGCGRTKNQHALNHKNETNHNLTIKLSTKEIWCYECQKYFGKDPHPCEVSKIDKVYELFQATKEEVELTKRRVLERSFANYEKNKKLYIINRAWFLEWHSFLIGDSGPPGVLNNEHVLSILGQMNVNEVSVVSEHTWKYLETTYSAQPAIPEDHPNRSEELAFILRFLRMRIDQNTST